jgi:hypothetical protein
MDKYNGGIVMGLMDKYNGGIVMGLLDELLVATSKMVTL